MEKNKGHDQIARQLSLLERGHSRRDFMKIAAMGYLGFLGLGCHKGYADPVRPQVLIADSHELLAMAPVSRGTSGEEIISRSRRVAEAATDFSWLSRNDTVFIKLASNSANTYPSTTSPLAVRAMVGLLMKKGAGKVLVGDKPGVQSVYQDEKGQKGAGRDILRRNGLYQAALESGAEIFTFDEADYDAYFPDHTVKGSHWKSDLMLPNILNQVDHVVLLPRVSRHVLAGTTLGLKAAVGWLRDDSRLELHRDARSFFEKTAEINDARVLKQKLRLVLSVATKVQTTFGPDKGFVSEPDPGLVFASESLLAHDMVSLGWLLWNRDHATPKGQLSWFRDPYVTYPGIMNRMFVASIWGMEALLRSETYGTTPILSVQTDPVIARAASMWGGLPRLEWVEVDGRVPEKITTYLREKATS